MTEIIIMDSDQHQSQQSEYNDSQWVHMGAYSNGGGQHNTTPMHEYASYNFGQSPVMPIEPAYQVSRPPPYTTHQQLQPLHPLITMAPWPSMLTSQASGYSPPVPQSAPLSTPVSASTASVTVTPVTTTGGSTPRRTLTDDDRRRMCEYHEAHPGVKQTEVGALFGVERSTVSKVLRQKEKYLYPVDSSTSPTKKSKNKFPDIERALVNWARNEQRKGEPLNDAKIKEQANRFAATVGSSESQSKLTNSAWLEKFKLKHNLLGNRQRKAHASSAHESNGLGLVDSSTTSFCERPISYSSSESPDQISMPTSPNPDHEQYEAFRSDDDFLDLGNDYQSGPNRRSVIMTNGDVQVTTSSASRPMLSPTAVALGNEIGHSDAPKSAGLTTLPLLGSSFGRPRSQTFPNLLDEPGKTGNSNQSTPKLPDRSVSVIPEDALEESPIAIDPRQTMKRIKSVDNIPSARASSMQPPPLPPIPRSENTSPISSNGSPTQDEARRALDLVWSFFQSQPAGILEPDEYATMGKLMVKLKLTQSPDGTPVLPGGMHPIDVSQSPRISKKRTFDGSLMHERVSA